ncbi:MAG TPA: sigma-70 family RNA polymerase sigma factor, partial [Actinomycetota bacterium]|nr:sigma-70 family RNA polymerase sigma factor [Actinomycetota bacterium]
MRSAAADITGEVGLVAALRAGDEQAFAALIDRYHSTMMRVASAYVPSIAVAEEAVQEAWLGVLAGLDRFQERSSLRTWIFRILVNVARTKGKKERRTLPFSSIEPEDDGDAASFLPLDDPSYPGHWVAPPVMPERAILGGEALAAIREAIEALPDAQRTVIVLRDEQGWSSTDVCNVLAIS